jgi:hypothetical protein
MLITGLDRGKNIQSMKRAAHGEIGICGTSEFAGNRRAAVVVVVVVVVPSSQNFENEVFLSF